MGNETTYSGMLGDLARLTAALGANAPDLAHLEGPRARLEVLLAEAQEVAKQQAALTASKQEASKRLKALVTESQRLASGVRKFLQEHYGLRSEKLAEFGLQPFRGRVRKAKPTNPDLPQTPNPTPTPPAGNPAPARSTES